MYTVDSQAVKERLGKFSHYLGTPSEITETINTFLSKNGLPEKPTRLLLGYKELTAYDTPTYHNYSNIVFLYDSKYVELGKRTLGIPLDCFIEESPYRKNYNTGFQGYVETVVKEGKTVGSYVGITTRDWLIRNKEHERDAFVNGSNRRVHQAMRSIVGTPDTFILKEYAGEADTFDKIMDWEEEAVKFFRASEIPCLNMVSGGYAGLREIHKFKGYSKEKIKRKLKISSDNKMLLHKDKVVREYEEKHGHIKLSNLILSAWMKSKSGYCNWLLKNPNTYNEDEVLEIVRLHVLGWDLQSIVQAVGGNINRVKGVLSGKHYSRVIGEI